MNIKYKSSLFWTIFQLFLSFILIALFLYIGYYYLSYGILIKSIESYMIPIFIWVSLVLIKTIFELRYIKVTEENIIIEGMTGDSILEYKDIVWVKQINTSKWPTVSIKYKDILKNKNKTIFIYPEIYNAGNSVSLFNNKEELAVTKYIREQIMNNNPLYQTEKEVSKWYVSNFILLSLIPFVLISIFLGIQ